MDRHGFDGDAGESGIVNVRMRRPHMQQKTRRSSPGISNQNTQAPETPSKLSHACLPLGFPRPCLTY